MQLIDGGEGDRAPNGADALALWCDIVEDDGLLFLGHRGFWRGFLRKIFDWKGKRSWEYTQISIKVPIYGGDFLSQMIGLSILITSENENGVVHVNKAQYKNEVHTEFYVKTLNREKPQRKRSFTINLRLQKLQEFRGCVKLKSRLEWIESNRIKLTFLSSLQKAYLYLIELSAWRQISMGEILITTKFAHVNLL